jgi:hypothetical protein
MAGETPKVAEAYILIRARDGGAREDIRRIGQQYGEDAGKAAAVAMGAEFAKSAPAELKKAHPALKKAGQEAGKVYGDAAGEQAAKTMGEKLRQAATTITVTAADLGKQFGQAIGAGAASATSGSLGSGLRKQLSASSLRGIGQRIGEDLGTEVGESMGRSLLAGMRRQIASGAPTITATVSNLPRLAIESGLAGAAAGESFAQRFAATAGPGLRGNHVAAEFGRHVNADFVKSGITAAGSFIGGLRAGVRDIRSAFTGSASAFRDVYSTYATYGRGVAGQFVTGFRNFAVAGLRLVWDDPRIFAARTYTRSGADAAQRFASAFGRGLGHTSGALQSAGKTAEKVLESSFAKGIGGGITTGLKGLSLIGGGAAGLAALGPAMTGAAAAAVQLSGAFGLLPGAASAAALGVGTLKIGTLGVTDAIEASSKGAKEYKESLKGLSSSARHFVDAVVDQKDAAKELQKSVQGRLFQNLGQDVRDLSDRYLPVLERKLSGVAGVFNVTARSVAKFLDSDDRSGQLERILTNDTRAMRNLGTAAKPVVAALLDLTEVGSSFLPGLADDAAASITNFAKKVQAAKDDGSLREYFQGGIDAAGDLIDAVEGAGRIVAGVFSAGGAANAAPLETFADGLNAIADVVNGSGFQAGLTDLFNAISDGGQAVFAVLPDVGDALVALEPAIAAIVRGSGAGLASTLESAASVAEDLAPALTLLAGGFEKVAPAIGPVVIGLIAFKGALKGLALAEAGLDFVTLLPGRLAKVGVQAKAAQASLIGMRGALATLGIAGVVVGLAALERGLQSALGKMAVGKVDTAGLATSLKGLGTSGELGSTGLDLFTNHGLFGLKSGVDSTGEALERFQNSAKAAFGDSLSEKLGRLQNGGLALEKTKDRAQQLDGALASLAKTDPGAAAASFQKLTDGLPTDVLAKVNALFPEYAAAAKAAGATSGTAAGQVTQLTTSLSGLQSQVSTAASAVLGSRDAARGYEAALDAASDAVTRNGQTLKIGTAAGRDNSAALDAIAAAGIQVANQFKGDGPAAQAKFRSSLQQTRDDLYTAARRFGLSKDAAHAYADQLIKIPPKATTQVSAPGLATATRNAYSYQEALDKLPHRKVTNVETHFFNYGSPPGTFGNGLGVYKNSPQKPMTGGLIDPQTFQRRNYGGLVNPRLGAPRQDNVPLLVSGGEFVMNAWAMKAPGVESLLRYINTANRLPDKLRQVSGYASGGKVASFGAAGMSDLSASQPARIQRTVISQAPAESSAPGYARIHPDDLAVLAALANRPMYVRLDDGTVAGSVVRNGGYA